MSNVLVRFTVGDQGPADEPHETAEDLHQELTEYAFILNHTQHNDIEFLIPVTPTLHCCRWWTLTTI